MPYLVHLYGGSPINHYVLKKPLTIGRGQHNDIHVDDPTLSAEHAIVEPCSSGGYQIRDLDSTNGVLYGGSRVRVQKLTDGDTVVLGTHDMQFVMESPASLERTRKIKRSWIPGIYYTEN